VTVYNKENYEIKFLMANKKMDVIINCLDGEDFHACLRLIAVSGKIFQLTKTDMKKKHKMGTWYTRGHGTSVRRWRRRLYRSVRGETIHICCERGFFIGMLTFLRNVSMFSVGMERILAENEGLKKNIRNSIERGLQNGTVRPFDRRVLTGACTGSQASETLE